MHLQAAKDVGGSKQLQKPEKWSTVLEDFDSDLHKAVIAQMADITSR